MRKTDRVYGEVTESIRKLSKTGAPFTITDVTKPATVRRLLGKMVEKGELTRVERGERGRKATVYQIA